MPRSSPLRHPARFARNSRTATRRLYGGCACLNWCDDEWGARYAEVEQPGPMVPRPTTARSRRQIRLGGGLLRFERRITNDLRDSGLCRRQRVSALADAAVEPPKDNLRCAGSRRDAVWQGWRRAGHAGRRWTTVADGAASDLKTDGALLPGEKPAFPVRWDRACASSGDQHKTQWGCWPSAKRSKARLAEHTGPAWTCAPSTRALLKTLRRLYGRLRAMRFCFGPRNCRPT